MASLRAAQYTSRKSAWNSGCRPSDFIGNYGVLGFTPDSLAPNWTCGSDADHPDLSGRQGGSRRPAGRSDLKQRQAQVDNLRGSIEQDIEDALLDLKAAAKQVEVAKTGLDYAQQTLGSNRRTASPPA